MRKFGIIVIAVLLSITLVGCVDIETEPIVEIKTISIRENTVLDSYDVESFSLSGLQLTVEYEDGKLEYIQITEEMISSSELEKLSTVGTYTIDVNYGGKTTTITIDIVDIYTEPIIEIKTISIRENTVLDSYDVESFSLSGLQLTVEYEDGKFEYIQITEEMISSSELEKLSTVGTYTIDVNYEGKTITIIIDIVNPEDTGNGDLQNGEQGVTNTTITVGNTVATSGALTFVGVPYSAGMQAYFDMVNRNGGIGGRTIKFIQYDDQFDATQGYTYTQKLVEEDKVFAIVGHFGTPTVSSTIDYLQGTGIPQVYFATGASLLFNENATGNERSSFPVQPIYDGEAQVMVARAVHDLNATKIGIIYSDDATGKALLNGATLQAETEGVTLFSYKVQVGDGDFILSQAATFMMNADVDIIVLAGYQGIVTTTIQALNNEGSTIPVIVSYLNESIAWLESIQNSTSSFDVYAGRWFGLFDESGVVFSDDYNEFITEISRIDSSYVANSFAMTGWIAGASFVEGLNIVGNDSLTWDSYITAMESAPIELPFEVIVDFTDGRRVGTQRMSLIKLIFTNGIASWETVQPFETIDEIVAK